VAKLWTTRIPSPKNERVKKIIILHSGFLLSNKYGNQRLSMILCALKSI
jgi:hypothetical protein